MSTESSKSEILGPLATIDRMVHEPARLLILAYLYVVESADFLFLLRQTELTKGNLSSHLGKLEAAGYVKIQKEFVDKIPRTLLKLSDQGREAFQAYRCRMQDMLNNLPE
ncbi:MAG: transcriptional regulator [Candidatus Marinimicrobia bacterium]|nr:transcriptional regulator [Candidatus Neomarinimicrobiota bacterium]